MIMVDVINRKVIKGWLSVDKIIPIQSVHSRNRSKHTTRINSSSFRICLTY